MRQTLSSRTAQSAAVNQYGTFAAVSAAASVSGSSLRTPVAATNNIVAAVNIIFTYFIGAVRCLAHRCVSLALSQPVV